MFNRILPDAAAWNLFALEIALKATLLLLLAAALVMLLRRTSAAVRHRVWALTFAGLLLLPVVQLFTPGLPWEVIPQNWQPMAIEVAASPLEVNHTSPAPHTAPPTESIAPIVAAAESQAVRPSANSAAESVAFRSAKDRDFRGANGDEASAGPKPAVHREDDDTFAALSAAWLSRLWLLGASIALIPWFIGLLENVRLRFHGRRLANPDWQCLLAALSHRLELRRSVTLLFGTPQQMPMTFGLLRPCVVLPSSAEHWSAQRRQIVLLHELAHIKRCDVPLQLIARLAAAVYWFHPLIWWALGRMRLEREHACDDCVLQAGQEAPDYATQLLEIARTHRSPTPLLNAALSMARPSQLEGRLLAVLDTHRRRNRVGRAAAFQLGILALALVVCLGLVRPTAEAEAPPSTDQNDPTVEQIRERIGRMVVSGKVLSPQGKPLPAASVEVIAYDRSTWRRGLGEDEIEQYQTRTGPAGDFRLLLPRDISRPHEFMQIIASAEGYALNEQMIESARSRNHVEIKLHEPKVVRLQLIDTAGHPLANVQPHLRSASWKEEAISIAHRDRHLFVAGWPQCSTSDEEGYISLKVPAPTKTLVLLVDDKKLGGHQIRVDVSDEPTSVALKPARFLNGKVTAADSGKPIAGAEVVMMEEPYRRVLTDADGTFRIAGGTTIDTLFPAGECIIHVYPPSESPYLFHALEWKWPNDGIGDAKLSVALERGIVIKGQVVEKLSAQPVSGARVYFEPQEKDNSFFRETAASRFSGSDMKYLTDSDGRFRMPAWPGPGYLIVRGPSLDFVHTQITYGDRFYGKPGLSREYHHGALRINLEPDKPPQPLKIELERGVTLRRKVVRPDGQPAEGKAYARSYLQDKDDIDSWLPDIPVELGVLELPGFEPERSKPIFVVDLDHHCAAIVSPTASEIDLAGPPIQLHPCGSAKFRFVTDKSQSLADYEPRLLLIFTSGAPATHYIKPDQPLWSESVIWQNVARPAKIPTTDADGRVTVNDLIPGATYRLSFVAKEGGWTDGYEFVVRSGETTDVGEVVIPERK
jgi:beta-lactamase regulating signal transducer with metallopeptidase domain